MTVRLSHFPCFAARRFVACALAFFLSSVAMHAQGRRVVVDPSNAKAFSTLSAAAATLRAGDTLWIAPNSGPYREVLFIQASGAADAPIIVEGNGNEITGFDVLRFETLADGRHVADVRVQYPFVLRRNGVRVMELAMGGRFPSGIEYDRVNAKLTLEAGISPSGWEISTRSFAVRVSNASHHIYRDLVASGSRNDGFNLHGTGVGLVFENIVGRQNLDEGFSAHASIECVVRGGEFFENDNGMLSGQNTRTRLERVDFRNNLGLGFGFNGEAVVEGERIRSWGNGMMQLLLRNGVSVNWRNVHIYRNAYVARPLLSHMESAKWQSPKTVEIPSNFKWLGEAPRISDDISPDDGSSTGPVY